MILISPLLFFIFIFLCFLGFRTCFLVFLHSGISFFGFLFICTSDRSDYYCVHPFIANYSPQNTVIVFEIIDKKINLLLLLFFSLSICQTPTPSSSPSPWPQKYSLLAWLTLYGKTFQVQDVHQWTALIRGRNCEEGQHVALIDPFCKIVEQSNSGM